MGPITQPGRVGWREQSLALPSFVLIPGDAHPALHLCPEPRPPGSPLDGEAEPEGRGWARCRRLPQSQAPLSPAVMLGLAEGTASHPPPCWPRGLQREGGREWMVSFLFGCWVSFLKRPSFLPEGFRRVGTETSASQNPHAPTGSARPEVEESLLQPALVLGKCSAPRLSPPPHLPLISAAPGSGTAISRVIKSQGMGGVRAPCPRRCL